MRIKHLIIALCLAGCASTGGIPATEANILQGTDAVVELAKTLYQDGKLSDAEGQSVIDAANAVVASVEAARSAGLAGDKLGSSAQLRAAADALDALAARLAAKKNITRT